MDYSKKLKKFLLLWFYVSLGWSWDIHVDHMPLRYLLQTLAELNHENIVLSEHIAGKLDLHLHDVSWKQFWTFLIKTQHLHMENTQHILWVDKAYSFFPQDKTHLGEPSIEFANVHILNLELDDLKKIFEDKQHGVLSPLGHVMFDAHSNRIWLADVPEYLHRAQQLLKSIDVPRQQVVIEARIVSMNKNYARDIGTRLGFTQPGLLSGELAGLHHAIEDKNVNINLPAIPIQATPMSFALSLAKLGQQYLDAELSFLEGKGGAKIIARPRLVTENQQEATISSGEDIPYQESSLNGATSVAFKKALLLLRVKPYVLEKQRIILELQINQDADSGQRVQGVPIIATKSMNTKVLMHSGETLVLGGIQKNDVHLERVGFPLLKNIPGLDFLFAREQKRLIQEELLLFITPKLV